MFEFKKFGDCELLQHVEMPEGTKAILTEILAQNRIILEANCLFMRLLEQPMMFVAKDSSSDA